MGSTVKTYQRSYSDAGVECEDVGDVVVDASLTWRVFTKR